VPQPPPVAIYSRPGAGPQNSLWTVSAAPSAKPVAQTGECFPAAAYTFATELRYKCRLQFLAAGVGRLVGSGDPASVENLALKPHVDGRLAPGGVVSFSAGAGGQGKAVQWNTGQAVPDALAQSCVRQFGQNRFGDESNSAGPDS
jgi:hypothetical protein